MSNQSSFSVTLNDTDMIKLRMLKDRYHFKNNIDALRFVITLATEEIVQEMLQSNFVKEKKAMPVPVYS